MGVARRAAQRAGNGKLALNATAQKELREPGHVPTPPRPQTGFVAAGSPPRAGRTFFGLQFIALRRPKELTRLFSGFKFAMTRDQEARHKSEEIDDSVLLDVIHAIKRRVRIINRSYDIPYIAGYSVDGRTVFIDRHLPKSFRWLTKIVRVDPLLLVHEIVEKALLDELRLHYLHAHQIALRAERDAVRATGVPWLIYQRFMKKYESPIQEEKLIRVPPQLDLTPYRDEKDFALLRRLVRNAA